MHLLVSLVQVVIKRKIISMCTLTYIIKLLYDVHGILQNLGSCHQGLSLYHIMMTHLLMISRSSYKVWLFIVFCLSNIWSKSRGSLNPLIKMIMEVGCWIVVVGHSFSNLHLDLESGWHHGNDKCWGICLSLAQSLLCQDCKRKHSPPSTFLLSIIPIS